MPFVGIKTSCEHLMHGTQVVNIKSMFELPSCCNGIDKIYSLYHFILMNDDSCITPMHIHISYTYTPISNVIEMFRSFVKVKLIVLKSVQQLCVLYL